MSHPHNQGRSLGEFRPADIWQTHVNTIFYGLMGPKIHDHFQTYVSRDYRLAHALAEDFFQQAPEKFPTGTVFVHEWGVGNGNLAACFLSHLKSLDTEGIIYPRTYYVLCDYSLEILNGVRNNERLKVHEGRFGTVRIHAEQLDCFKPNSAHKIISNEIWDDLATRVLMKHRGTLYEEYLHPVIDPSITRLPFDPFSEAFESADLNTLANEPPFLDQIFWERDFQRTEISDWPLDKAIADLLDNVNDEIPVPINTGAFETLSQAFALLVPGHLGYTGFDYGMLTMEDLNREGRPYFRLYGGQYTNMVNFPLLENAGKALGFQTVTCETQHAYVTRHIGDAVISAVELVQVHPKIHMVEPWDVDLLMLATLHTLNANYRNPYPGKLDYPAVAGTPKKQRKEIAKRVKALSAKGVPDTVAYITETEVRDSLSGLRKLGYREQDVDTAFQESREPIRFGHLTFQ